MSVGSASDSAERGLGEGSALAVGLVHHDRDRVREVQRAHLTDRGDAVNLVGVLGEQLVWEAHALATEHQGVVRPERRVEVALLSGGGEKPRARARMSMTKVRPIEVTLQLDERPVIEPGAPHGLLIDREAQLSDEVQRKLKRRGEARDVSRVLRDLGVDEDDSRGRREAGGSEARTVLGHGETVPISEVGAHARVRLSTGTLANVYLRAGRCTSLADLGSGMRAVGRFLGVALAAMTSLVAGVASADKMDPSIERFVLNSRCIGTVDNVGKYYDPTAGFTRCLPDNLAFAKLVAQYGTAIGPTPSYAARTTGFGGFKIGVQGAYTTIDSDAPYWKKGTQGPVDKSTNQYSVVNNGPDDLLQVYSVRLAKGFPFGFELGASFGHIANTSLVTGGGDVRLSVLEGFRTNYGLGYLPDLAATGGIRTITGTSQLKLTVVSVDGVLSKPIPIQGSVILQPHVGYQWLRIFGDSGVVDMTPNTDPVQHCGYRGDNNPATPDPSKKVFDGQPNCAGSSADFNNNVVFDAVRLNRHRINAGLDLRFQMVYLGLNFLADLIPVAEANTATKAVPDGTDPSASKTIAVNPFADDPRTSENDAVKSQITFSVELGAVF